MDTLPVGASAYEGLVTSDARGFPAWGLGCSALLHLLTALLFAIGLPVPTPPQMLVPVPVEFVQFDQKGASPGRQKDGGGQPARSPPEVTPQPQKRDPVAEVKPQPQKRQPDLPNRELSKRAPLAEGKTPRNAPPVHDDIDTLLRVAENAHRDTATPAGQTRKSGPLLSQPAGTDHSAGQGQKGTRAVKDFIRAQIERHWEFDLRDLGATDLMVSLHLKLTADGSVDRADVIEDPRYGSDVHYHSIAMSARNAALASSPLHLPPGTYDAVKDVTVTLDPREALR